MVNPYTPFFTPKQAVYSDLVSQKFVGETQSKSASGSGGLLKGSYNERPPLAVH